MNDKENKIKYTKNFWQDSYSEELTDSDALEIIDTTTALISFFNDVVKKHQNAREAGDAFMG